MVVKHRSPNYPGIDLEECVQVLAPLYQGVSRGQFTPADAAKAWGYNSTGGPVKIRLASLRQFGLLDGKKGENPRLSNHALTLILRNQASREYQQAIREAAEAPSLFAELNASMHAAAPDALRQHLIVERGFTDEGANRFIEVFRSTIALANPPEYGNMEGQDSDNSSQDDEEQRDMPPPSPPPPPPPYPGAPVPEGSMTIPVNFAPDKVGTVTLPINMTEGDWERLDRILTAYRPDKTVPAQSGTNGNGVGADGESEESNS